MATSAQVTAFIALIAPIIQAEAAAHGYDYPSAIIAQACIESAYGTSSLGYKYHNYFGMKCGSSWTGKSVNLRTKEEYTQGVLTDISANWRVYDTDEEGVRGYFDFISKARYNNLKDATSSRDYLEKIKADGYATSFSYVDTVYKVVEQYNLTQYDTQPTTLKEADVNIVGRVLNRELGNGSARVANVNAAGYDYHSVQKKVNEVCACADKLRPLKKELGEYFDLAVKLV